MSHSLANLSNLRTQLSELNCELFDLFAKRSDLTQLIQAEKGSTLLSHYDAKREKNLFSELHLQLAGLSLRELASFSLLMESHAGAPEKYPAWSEGVHLVGPGHGIQSLINPLLLKETHPELFKTLKLKTDFSFLLSI